MGSIMCFYVVDRLKIDFKWKLLLVFTVMMSLIGLLEIGEYLLDVLFDLKLQGVFIRDISGLEKLNPVQSRIDDTMIDMILGVIGSGLFSLGKTITHFYRRRIKRKIIM